MIRLCSGYFPLGGLLPRPGPEGLPVLLGQLGLFDIMFFIYNSLNN